jgi:hypothetical protein
VPLAMMLWKAEPLLQGISGSMTTRSPHSIIAAALLQMPRMMETFLPSRAVAVETELPFGRKFVAEVHDHCVRFFPVPHGVAHDFAAIKNRFHLLSISNFAVSSAQFIFSYEKADVFRAPASNLI